VSPTLRIEEYERFSDDTDTGEVSGGRLHVYLEKGGRLLQAFVYLDETVEFPAEFVILSNIH
jgi:hypothetical protein